MKSLSRTHLSDPALLHDLDTRLAEDHTSTASLLATLAEVDARKLYLPAGYASMFAFCTGRLHMSEDATYKRIQAGRAARRFPAIFAALAEGRLHLAAVVMLAAHLTPENAGELITAAMHKTKAQIELLLAERFPQPDLVASIEPIAPTRPAETTPTCPKHVCETRMQLAPGQVESRERPRVKPLAPERFGIQFTISEKTRAKLEHAQALRSHSIPGRDIAELFDRALDLLIAQAERERFAATDKPRLGRRSRNPRHIPAHVRREVWQRDQGRCTFVSESGHRCESPGHPPRGG